MGDTAGPGERGKVAARRRSRQGWCAMSRRRQITRGGESLESARGTGGYGDEEGSMRAPAGYGYPAGYPIQARPAVERRPGVVRDVWNGAVRGDFARTLGVAGGVTQIIISFLPLFGTLAAMRDIVADLKYHDRLGCAFNTLALVPFFGGVSKTMDVIRIVHHAGHVVHVAQRRNHQR